MKLMKLRELCEKLGIPRRTFNQWAIEDPELTVFIKGPRTKPVRWVKLERLAGHHGITLTDVYMLGTSRWIKAVDLATQFGLSRRTVAYWCRNRSGFAKRIGRNYYVDLEQLGASYEDVEELFRKRQLGKTGKLGTDEGVGQVAQLAEAPVLETG